MAQKFLSCFSCVIIIFLIVSSVTLIGMSADVRSGDVRSGDSMPDGHERQAGFSRAHERAQAQQAADAGREEMLHAQNGPERVTCTPRQCARECGILCLILSCAFSSRARDATYGACCE